MHSANRPSPALLWSRVTGGVSAWVVLGLWNSCRFLHLGLWLSAGIFPLPPLLPGLKRSLVCGL